MPKALNHNTCLYQYGKSPFLSLSFPVYSEY
uniref:Uncharacterized protein n=1 Tax=Rhizophora mucronata TaxID=61149 RepID=A0A2P2QPI5_RHIMU